MSITRKLVAVLSVAAFVASIVAANWMTSTFGLVPIGFGLLVTAGTAAAHCTTLIQPTWEKDNAVPLSVRQLCRKTHR